MIIMWEEHQDEFQYLRYSLSCIMEDKLKSYRKILKNLYKVKNRPITTLIIALTFLSVVLAATIFSYAQGPKYLGGTSRHVNNQTANALGKGGSSKLFGVLKEIDTDSKLVTLFDISSKQDVILSYTGGTNILDKYGQVISIDQMPAGVMVDAIYEMDDSKLLKLQQSKKGWEYADASDVSINADSNVIQAAVSKYKYNKNTLVFENNKQIDMEDIARQDELTLRGYKEMVWSITVNKGHGIVKLSHYIEFLGGNITVGYEDAEQITDKTAITTREGRCNITVETGEFTATKSVLVKRNKVNVVSLANLGPTGVKMGRVTFDITPFGADLFIDTRLASYANPIRLTYGTHSVKVSLDGYTTFNGTLNVNEAGKTIKIVLPKADSSQAASSSGTANNSNTNSTNNNTNAQNGTNVQSNTNNSNTAGNSGSTAAQNNNNTSNDTNAQNSTQSNTNNSNNQTTNNKAPDVGHKIYIQNPEGASVYLDGDYLGKSPGGFKKVTGSHVLTFIKQGYTTKSYTVNISNDGKDTYFSLPNLVKSKK